jgi:hypothetical protein
MHQLPPVIAQSRPSGDGRPLGLRSWQLGGRVGAKRYISSRNSPQLAAGDSARTRTRSRAPFARITLIPIPISPDIHPSPGGRVGAKRYILSRNSPPLTVSAVALAPSRSRSPFAQITLTPPFRRCRDSTTSLPKTMHSCFISCISPRVQPTEAGWKPAVRQAGMPALRSASLRLAVSRASSLLSAATNAVAWRTRGRPSKTCPTFVAIRIFIPGVASHRLSAGGRGGSKRAMKMKMKMRRKRGIDPRLPRLVASARS